MTNGMNGITWEEQTQARLDEARDKERRAREQQRGFEQVANHWAEYANTLAKVLELAREHGTIKLSGQHQIDSESLRKKSVREALIDIAVANNGLLVCTTAAQVLVDANVFADREHARNSIYAALHSAKRYFKKERKGIYQLVTTQTTLPVLRRK